MSTYDGASSGGGAAGGEGIKERAVETVAEVDAGAMHVAGVAGDEVGNVAHEAKDAARGFLAETRAQLTDQASTQQHRAAEALRSTGDELSGMASGAQSDGMAAGLVRGLGEQSKNVASWLDEREPGDLVREVRGFARRHTGAFVVAAIGLGIVAGRLTRALMSDDSSGSTGGTGGGMAATSGRAGAAGTAPGATGATGLGGAAGAGGVGGQTPIGDALADRTAGSGSATGVGVSQPDILETGESGRDEWSPSGEARP